MSASHPTQYVFAYGSLVRDLAPGEGQGTKRGTYLRDHRRAWNVAMDNSISLPGYKYYLDASDSSRPEVFVTFLNLVPAPGHRVNGMLVPVGTKELIELDRRERNYERREVTGSIEQPFGGRVWSYFGRPEACQRFDGGLLSGRAVVDESYLEGVRAGFEALAGDALVEFDASTDSPGCRLLRLSRVDLG
jgi:Gamma-glutamyl cyclotransferase, AIG2-like